nr:unnamed protein product [Digitaria exilis]
MSGRRAEPPDLACAAAAVARSSAEGAGLVGPAGLVWALRRNMATEASTSAAGAGGGSWVEGMSADNIKGLVLALSSSIFIGASFIVKKKGLKKAGASGVRAGVGGYSYLYEPLWWAGMITMIVGEVANFAAYAFAPAILVTPLGALSIIVSAVLADIMLKEKLHIFGILGCVLCVVGSTTIVLHAPQERAIESVAEVWILATEPAFLSYAAIVLAATFVLIYYFIPQYGQTHIMVYIGVCSLVGSLSDWDRQNPTQIVTEMCGFVTILSGTFLLHKTKDMVDGLPPTLPVRIPKHTDEDDYGAEGIPLRSAAEGIPLRSPRAAESFRSTSL